MAMFILKMVIMPRMSIKCHIFCYKKVCHNLSAKENIIQTKTELYIKLY